MPSAPRSLAEKLASKERILADDGRFSIEEVQLALRNRGMSMEALLYETTPSARALRVASLALRMGRASR